MGMATICPCAEALVAHDPGDADTAPRGRPPMAVIAAEEPPVPPTLAFAKTAVWDQADKGAAIQSNGNAPAWTSAGAAGFTDRVSAIGQEHLADYLG